MTQAQLEAGRAWLKERSEAHAIEAADIWPALLAFLGAYMARLEAEAVYGAHAGTTWTDVSVALVDAQNAEDDAWLALIEGAGDADD